MSKIQFWKQFTTNAFLAFSLKGCYWYVKDTILKAIHNHSKIVLHLVMVVTDMSKIQFWKQFTTVGFVFVFRLWLLLICQRYNFESNSQQIYLALLTNSCCYWYVKDTILKAIHNFEHIYLKFETVVTDMSKIQFWKQFTTIKTTRN